MGTGQGALASPALPSPQPRGEGLDVTIPDQTGHPPPHITPQVPKPGRGEGRRGAAEDPTFPKEKLLSSGKGHLNLQRQSGPDCPSPPRG